MSAFTDGAATLLARAIRIAGVEIVFGVAGAIAGLLGAYLLYRLGAALLRRVGRRRVRVESLVAQGVSRAEIARRTGLSQDAVTMLLRTRGARRGRRNLPAPARIAALKSDRAHRRNRDWSPQPIADTQFSYGGTMLVRSARRLPFSAASHAGFTRSRQTS